MALESYETALLLAKILKADEIIKSINKAVKNIWFFLILSIYENISNYKNFVFKNDFLYSFLFFF